MHYTEVNRDALEEHSKWIGVYSSTLLEGLYSYCDNQDFDFVNPTFYNFAICLRRLDLFKPTRIFHNDNT